MPRIGIWVAEPGGGESKIAAIGVRVRKWVSYHGIALNVAPDLEHYRGIVPCGISEHGVTSLAALGVAAGMAEADVALKAAFDDVFGEGGSMGICNPPSPQRGEGGAHRGAMGG